MHVLNVRNVHNALPLALDFICHDRFVQQTDSRNGPVRKAYEPVTTRYDLPKERVMFWPERNANPFFHFMESLWMLAGRKDVAWIKRFNSSFEQFSDNGKDFHGAYGHRWRNHFLINDLYPMDQLLMIVNILKKNPVDRRCVLTMWDPTCDLGHEGKDFPCNTQIYFDATHGQLNMTVTCRSNDIVWGAYGANAVHFSVLQEVLATMIGIPVGVYWQLSNNWHGYLNTMEKVLPLRNMKMELCPYELNEVQAFPIMNTEPSVWWEDLEIFMDEGPIVGFRDPFFRRVVTPIYNSWMAKEQKSNPDRWDNALEIIQQCSASDWKKACREWLNRNRKDQ
jgi:thymidylate synthase